MNEPPIITAVDLSFVRYLAVLVMSLAKLGKKYQLIIIFRGISKEVRDNIESLVIDRLSVIWKEVTVDALAAANLPVENDLSPHYFRLLAPTLLPTDERALYLDADTLVRADLTPLLRWPLKSYPVAAVTDDILPKIKNDISNYSDFGLDPEAPYFNSGVMVLDLELWRTEGIARRTLNICRQNAAYLQAKKQWPTYEQYGLNTIFANRWSILPNVWNHGAFLPDNGARIVHFLGHAKPEFEACQKVFKEEFFALLAKTPWRI